jgi:hypothetical protein
MEVRVTTEGSVVIVGQGKDGTEQYREGQNGELGKVGGDSEVRGEGTMRGRDGTERIVQPDEYDAP